MGFEEMRGYLTDAAAAERACSPSWAAALENEVDLLCWSIAGSYDFGDDYTARRGIARMAVMCAAVERSGPAAARAALESHVRECCDRALPPDAAEGACAWEALQRIVADQPGTYLGAGLFESAVGALRSSALGDAPRAARHIESWLGIGAGEMLGIVESRLDGDPGAARLSESWGREVYESLFARELEAAAARDLASGGLRTGLQPYERGGRLLAAVQVFEGGALAAFRDGLDPGEAAALRSELERTADASDRSLGESDLRGFIVPAFSAQNVISAEVVESRGTATLLAPFGGAVDMPLSSYRSLRADVAAAERAGACTCMSVMSPCEWAARGGGNGASAPLEGRREGRPSPERDLGTISAPTPGARSTERRRTL